MWAEVEGKGKGEREEPDAEARRRKVQKGVGNQNVRIIEGRASEGRTGEFRVEGGV